MGQAKWGARVWAEGGCPSTRRISAVGRGVTLDNSRYNCRDSTGAGRPRGRRVLILQRKLLAGCLFQLKARGSLPVLRW